MDPAGLTARPFQPSQPPASDLLFAVSSQGALLGQHSTAINPMAEALRSLTEEVRHLGAQPRFHDPPESPCNPSQSVSLPLTSAVNPAPLAVSSPSRESPVSLPDKYSGMLGSCEGFLVQCAVVFRRQTATFSSDEGKVCFVAGLLCDWALTWFTSVSEGQPHLLS